MNDDITSTLDSTCHIHRTYLYELWSPIFTNASSVEEVVYFSKKPILELYYLLHRVRHNNIPKYFKN